jgi:hypothetical protein
MTPLSIHEEEDPLLNKKNEMVNLLKKLDPINSSKYQDILSE